MYAQTRPADNCPAYFNPDQADSNQDGIGDACEFFCGDSNRDSSIDIDDIVHIIAYIFASGEPPNPVIVGDVDCSGARQLVSILVLVDSDLRRHWNQA